MNFGGCELGGYEHPYISVFLGYERFSFGGYDLGGYERRLHG